MLLKDKRVFVVEDNAGNLAIISLILSQNGAQVHFERWGVASGARLLQFMPVDIILLDLMLPNNVTGYDVFDQIRRMPELAHIPIVAVTAADPDKEMSKARQKGFNGFISKPIRLNTFGKYVADAIRGEEVWMPG
jgi:CheY-like chemotaxis protein